MNIFTKDINNISLQNEYDIIVVGSGICGSVIARLCAEECDKKILIIEKRSTVSGNMYDEIDENGVRIQKYGPHVFFTDKLWIYDFISRFSKWVTHKPKCGVEIEGKRYPIPFGFQTIRMIYDEIMAEELINRLKTAYPNRQSVPVLELLSSDDQLIVEYASYLYEMDYKPYAAKQWNMAPSELDQSVTARLPVHLSENPQVSTAKYQILPENGYLEFFENMLSHDKIDVLLNTDALSILNFDLNKGVCMKTSESNPQEVIKIPIVFTGALEDIFDSDEPLPYRSLCFEYKTQELHDLDPYDSISFPSEHEYLRMTDFSKMMIEYTNDKTTILYEYPYPYDKSNSKGNEPYYPIIAQSNVDKNNLYIKKLSNIPNVIPCGRLADYKYYNMDKALERAFEVFAKIKKEYW